MIDSKVLKSLVAVGAIAVATAACADGNGATPLESEAAPSVQPSMAAAPTQGGPPLQAMLRGFKAIVDMTQTLDANTPVIELPPPFANSPGFSRETVSYFDDRGPGWAWYTVTVGEHTGTHLDVPCHWASGRDLACVDDIPMQDLVGPAVVIDVRDKVANDDDYLVTVEDALEWERRHGRIPAGAWVILQTGWADRYVLPELYLNGGHSPGPSLELSEFLAYERDVLGIGVETVGTDAGIAGGFDIPFPNHHVMLGAGKFGLASLANVDQLPAKGAILFAAPIKMRGGTGSPARVFALIP